MELELESILLPGIEDKRPMVIAGPCSAETEEQVMCTAKQLAEKGMKIFRAGIWKPRTKPGGFEGVGVDGLAWLKEVKKETGMYVSTEVATSKHVYECLKAGIDILWIGARTTASGSEDRRRGRVSVRRRGAAGMRGPRHSEECADTGAGRSHGLRRPGERIQDAAGPSIPDKGPSKPITTQSTDI